MRVLTIELINEDAFGLIQQLEQQNQIRIIDLEGGLESDLEAGQSEMLAAPAHIFVLMKGDPVRFGEFMGWLFAREKLPANEFRLDNELWKSKYGSFPVSTI